MADRILLESGAPDGYLLEDGTGVLLDEIQITLVTPTTLSVVTATFAPTVAVSDNKSVTPTTASLTTATFAPTVTATAHVSVTPTTASLSTSTFAPTVATPVLATPQYARGRRSPDLADQADN